MRKLTHRSNLFGAAVMSAARPLLHQEQTFVGTHTTAVSCHNKRHRPAIGHLVGAAGHPHSPKRALWNIEPRASRAYSTLMLAARITLPHFSASSSINLPKSEAESASTLPPEFTSCAFILGSARPGLISLLSLSMISAGVFFGAPMPCHALAS